MDSDEAGWESEVAGSEAGSDGIGSEAGSEAGSAGIGSTTGAGTDTDGSFGHIKRNGFGWEVMSRSP